MNCIRILNIACLVSVQVDGEYISSDEELDNHIDKIEATVIPVLDDADEEETNDTESTMAEAVQVEEELQTNGEMYTQSCESILVCTGVYSQNTDLFSIRQDGRYSNHNHRDFVINPALKKPHHMVANIFDAVKLVFEKEGADRSIFDTVKPASELS